MTIGNWLIHLCLVLSARSLSIGTSIFKTVTLATAKSTQIDSLNGVLFVSCDGSSNILAYNLTSNVVSSSVMPIVSTTAPVTLMGLGGGYVVVASQFNIYAGPYTVNSGVFSFGAEIGFGMMEANPSVVAKYSDSAFLLVGASSIVYKFDASSPASGLLSSATLTSSGTVAYAREVNANHILVDATNGANGQFIDKVNFNVDGQFTAGGKVGSLGLAGEVSTGHFWNIISYGASASLIAYSTGPPTNYSFTQIAAVSVPTSSTAVELISLLSIVILANGAGFNFYDKLSLAGVTLSSSISNPAAVDWQSISAQQFYEPINSGGILFGYTSGGNYLVGLITPACSVSNCVSCGNGVSTTCQKCAATFYLINNTVPNQCSVIASLPASYGANLTSVVTLWAVPCQDANCVNCQTIHTVCVQCTAGFYVLNGSCFAPASFPTGYGISGNNAVPCTDANCVNCVSNNAICTLCIGGYYTYLSACINVTSVPAGFGISGTAIVACSDAQCSNCSLSFGTCVLCNAGFYVYNASCYDVPHMPPAVGANLTSAVPCSDAHCAVCSANFSVCTSCIAGWYVLQGSCLQVNSMPVGYGVAGGAAVQCVDANCMNCSTSATTCTSCNSNWYLTSSNTCINKTSFTPTQGVDLTSLTVRTCRDTTCQNCKDDYTICTPQPPAVTSASFDESKQEATVAFNTSTNIKNIDMEKVLLVYLIDMTDMTPRACNSNKEREVACTFTSLTSSSFSINIMSNVSIQNCSISIINGTSTENATNVLSSIQGGAYTSYPISITGINIRSLPQDINLSTFELIVRSFLQILSHLQLPLSLIIKSHTPQEAGILIEALSMSIIFISLDGVPIKSLLKVFHGFASLVSLMPLLRYELDASSGGMMSSCGTYGTLSSIGVGCGILYNIRGNAFVILLICAVCFALGIITYLISKFLMRRKHEVHDASHLDNNLNQNTSSRLQQLLKAANRSYSMKYMIMLLDALSPILIFYSIVNAYYISYDFNTSFSSSLALALLSYYLHVLYLCISYAISISKMYKSEASADDISALIKNLKQESLILDHYFGGMISSKATKLLHLLSPILTITRSMLTSLTTVLLHEHQVIQHVHVMLITIGMLAYSIVMRKMNVMQFYRLVLADACVLMHVLVKMLVANRIVEQASAAVPALMIVMMYALCSMLYAGYLVWQSVRAGVHFIRNLKAKQPLQLGDRSDLQRDNSALDYEALKPSDLDQSASRDKSARAPTRVQDSLALSSSPANQNPKIRIRTHGPDDKPGFGRLAGKAAKEAATEKTVSKAAHSRMAFEETPTPKPGDRARASRDDKRNETELSSEAGPANKKLVVSKQSSTSIAGRTGKQRPLKSTLKLNRLASKEAKEQGGL